MLRSVIEKLGDVFRQLLCYFTIDCIILNCAYYLQRLMNNLYDIEESNSDGSLLYKTAVEELSRLDISEKGESPKSVENIPFLRATANPRPKQLFRRHNSAPVTSTPISRIRSESNNQSAVERKKTEDNEVLQMEELVLRLSLEDKQKSAESRQSRSSRSSRAAFSKEEALAIHTSMARGLDRDSGKNAKVKLYYQSVAPHLKTKRMGIRM